MTLNELIIQIAKKTVNPILDVSICGAKRIEVYDIDCSELDDYNDVDITESEKYRSLFDKLKSINGPALYFFEVTSDHSKEEIISRFRAYSKLKNSKVVPAIKKTIPDSKVLYVGKVKRDFYGRLIQHLGFFRNPTTQGLQLFYWANDITIKLTVFEFELNMINLMSVLENELAEQLMPMLGKHKS